MFFVILKSSLTFLKFSVKITHDFKIFWQVRKIGVRHLKQKPTPKSTSAKSSSKHPYAPITSTSDD
jgi:hypothetical protein